MLDPLPKIIVELREDSAVHAIAGDRIRGYEPAPGDSQPLSQFKAFVVLVRLDSPPNHTVPIQNARIAARCYGRDKEEAFALYAACSAALHHAGPRIHSNGLGIYISHDDSGAQQDRDPNTKQPLEIFFIDLFATTQAVAV